jgi:hypothetical protein
MSTAAPVTAHDAVVDAFMTKRGELLAALDAIHAFFSEGFADTIDPEEIHWGHVGDLETWIEQLKRIDLAGWGEG